MDTSLPLYRGAVRSSDNLTKTYYSLVILALVLILPFGTLAGADQTTCINPPSGNPNGCHLFIWSPFPTDQKLIPSTGLFNNDSSYQFAIPISISTITQFKICAYLYAATNANSNATLYLQYQEPGGFWSNVDSSNTHSAGSLSAPGQIQPGSLNAFCSNTFGTFNSTLVNDNCIPPLGTCNFRIAGNEGQCINCSGPDEIIVSDVSIIFQLNTLNSVISCTTTTHTVTAATIQCRTNIVSAFSTTITVSWEADNRTGTGAGCGASSTCQKLGSVNCIIPIGAATCQVNAPYGETFTGSVFVATSYSVTSLGGLATTPFFAETVLS